MERQTLTVFPAEPAKRRFERQRATDAGVLSTAGLMTGKRLTVLCERAARRQGLLHWRAAGGAETELLLREAAEAAREQFASSQPLAALSSGALAEILRQALETFAVFAEQTGSVIEWLCAHEPAHKLAGIGLLLKSWQALCADREIADRIAVNTALLRLVDEGELPEELKNGTLQFRAVRWLNPFDERFIAALKQRLGPGRVQIFSVLPGAHAEAAEDRLNATVRSELMRGAEEEWKPWLEDFADAFEADDSNILESESRERVAFFESAHPYGEIEDAARRIAREIETGTRPEEIALILRNLSPYTDIIPDVFARYGIPYHFRRGAPAAAFPPVKTLLALLAFPQTRSRDRYCDLLLNPGIQWPHLGLEERQQLAQSVRQNELPTLARPPQELDLFQTWQTPQQFTETARTLIRQHALELPEPVLDLLDDISGISARPQPPEQLVDLFEKLLGSVTLKDQADTESGVWILNPMDAAGLRFDSAYLAGMDDRTFPQIPKADALLNKEERRQLRAFLEERRIPCPRLTLSEAGEALIQEEILFLTAISTARERLTLSYTRTDADGKERAPGEFFERMRGLTGIGQPELGESFHTILPPALCRAEDEVRQTVAMQSRTGFQPVCARKEPTDSRQAGSLSYISEWLEKNPEFSATALECLARNRFVFFLEQMLYIRPERTREDDTDPLDRGSLLHAILEKTYTAIAAQSGFYADRSSGRWTLAQSGDIPLAVMDPSKSAELLELARQTALEEFKRAEFAPQKHLGRRGIWETEKQKLLKVVENVIRTDLESALAENRYPALFEMKFGEKYDLPVTLVHGGEEVRLKGKVDRIDLIFNGNRELERLLVIDYKGKSRGVSVKQLEKEVELNLDCQLPVYTFAAQQRLFGEHNAPELNSKTAAVYHIQERDLDKMQKQLKNKRLEMTPELTDLFLEQLFDNVRLLRAGDLATEPLIAGYEDYSHICRTKAIDPKDLLKEK